MSDPGEPYLVFSTAPDAETAHRIATHLVEFRLAACVNILSGIESVYRWKDAVQHDNELLLIVKTTRAAYPALQEAIVGLHPYELPEVVAVAPVAGLPAYLNWISNSLETTR